MTLYWQVWQIFGKFDLGSSLVAAILSPHVLPSVIKSEQEEKAESNRTCCLILVAFFFFLTMFLKQMSLWRRSIKLFLYVLPTEEAGTEIMYPSNLSSLIRTMDKNKRVLTDLMNFPHFRECLFLYSVANGKKMPVHSFFVYTMVLTTESLCYQSNPVISAHIKANGWCRIFRRVMVKDGTFLSLSYLVC